MEEARLYGFWASPYVYRVIWALKLNKPVAESLVILEYIEETWPQNPLLPADPHERAMARFWLDFGQQKGLTFFSFFLAAGEDKEKATREVLEILKIIQDQALADNKFFGGYKIGLLDISLGWLVHWFRCMQEVVGLHILEPSTLPRFT
ncbi:Glutathione S-transferase U7 [Abeliophyllum distichum]|uniref:Glutathione S-transferase n=1 Tax=Abeliophyllum distichum TaxID=126358 RepID=A0ABD1SGH3_9LAMI